MREQKMGDDHAPRPYRRIRNSEFPMGTNRDALAWVSPLVCTNGDVSQSSLGRKVLVS